VVVNITGRHRWRLSRRLRMMMIRRAGGRRLQGARLTRGVACLVRHRPEGQGERHDQRNGPSAYHLLRVYPHAATYAGRSSEAFVNVPSGARYTWTRLRRRALPTTDTELRLIAKAAIIGFSNKPVNGYSTPAATGTPSAL